MNTYFITSSKHRQTGSTLIVSLIILILIMMLGVMAVSTSDMQFKLSGNLQFEDDAMNRAETVIASAEEWLATGTNYKDAGFAAYATAHLYPAGYLKALGVDPLSMNWDNSNSVQVGGQESQRYFIESVALNQTLATDGIGNPRAVTGCRKVNTYLIAARGQGARGASKFIQSYFSVLSC
jgi:Tfp pilus assembly protein PilX